MNEVNASEHWPVKAEMEYPVLPGFGQVIWTCRCGLQHFWLVTESEVALGVDLMGALRDIRKEQDETFSQDFPQGPAASVDLGEGSRAQRESSEPEYDGSPRELEIPKWDDV